MAIGIIPALIGGVTFGGFAGLLRHLRREDLAAVAGRTPRAARQAATTSDGVAAIPTAAQRQRRA